MIEPHELKEISPQYAEENNRFSMFLKSSVDSRELDRQFCDLHNEIFHKEQYNCCKCNNCCKCYDIGMIADDISAIAAYLGLAEAEFMERYLIPYEEDNDYFIMKEKPCCFLQAEGKCGIYECRPLACKEFPHTKKQDRLFSLLGLLGYAEDCPVVFEILERLKRIYNFK